MSARDELVRRPPCPAEEFPTVDPEVWRAAAERSLGHGTLADLHTEIADGVVERPLYTSDDATDDSGYPGLAPYVRGGQAITPAVDGWRACLRCDHPDPTVAASWIAAASKHSVGAVWVVAAAAARLGLDAADIGDARSHDGVGISSLSDLDPLLGAISEASATIHLDGGGNGVALAAAVLAADRRRGGRPGRLKGSLGCDPLAALAGDGTLAYGLDRSLELMAAVAAWVGRSEPDLAAVTVSTLPYVAAGADPVRELAYAAATSVEYLRRMTAAGLELEVACRHLDFRVTVGLDLFCEIAKLRALRRIWSRIVEVSGGGELRLRAPIHAVTSPRWLTRRDPWVNMLRGTNAAFAAVAGGAELVTVLPFDAAIGPPDEFGQRIAANLHAILREESQLGRILDPAGGSYFVERLTADLAEAAWSRFQEIERVGGMASFLMGGGLRRDLEAADRDRSAAVATGRRPIVGVTVFADLAETAVERPPVPPDESSSATRAGDGSGPADLLAAVERAAAAGRADGDALDAAVAALEAGASLGEVAAAIRGECTVTAIEPLPARRDSEDFERLRDQSDALMARSGTRPTAFLVGIGAPSPTRSCLDFARGVLAAGGIETVDGSPSGETDDPAKAFSASGAQIACICVAVGYEPDRLPLLAAALRAAGARSVAAVAGRQTSAPGCRKAGVDHALREGEDVVGVLASLLAACGGVDG